MRHHQRWTADDDAALIAAAPNHSLAELAALLGRTPKSVRKRRSKLAPRQPACGTQIREVWPPKSDPWSANVRFEDQIVSADRPLRASMIREPMFSQTGCAAAMTAGLS